MPPRAKKDKGDDAPKEEAKAKAKDVMQVISGNKLKSLMASKRSATQDTAEINGTLGSEIKAAVKDNHLHRGAFRDICKLDRMEPEALRLYMDNFEYYFDVSGLKKRSESVMRMPLEGGEEDEEGEADGKVHKFPAAAE